MLGLRLLKIDASLVVSPARLAAAPRPAGDGRPVGAALAAAERCIEDGAATLERSVLP